MVTAAKPAYLEEPTTGGANTITSLADASEADRQLSSARSEPVSLASSEQSEPAANSASTDSDYGDSDGGASTTSEAAAAAATKIKCSAVHTLERNMPDFDYSHLVGELRKLILDHARNNAGLYSPADVDKCAHDDWFLSRFLLRHQLNLEGAFEMLKQALRFNNESMASHLRPQDFPAEFYQLGGLFPFGVDRRGNKMLYLRVKLHKKTPEIAAIVQAFIYFNIKRVDDEAQGKGISIVFDCSGGGLANADMDTLLFFVSTLKNYFPKGLSYFLVHELPWILKPFWHIAKAWIPDEHRQLIKFSDSSTIFEYIDRDNLPDFLGGTSGRPHSQVPEDCTTLEQAAKLWGVDRRTMMRVLDKFRGDLPVETIDRIEGHFAKMDEEEEEQEAAVAAAAAERKD